MSDKTFLVSGTYKEKKTLKNFEKKVKAHNENYAKEKALSEIGSKHKVNRHAITITNVMESKEG